jgi:hypothetical protein
MIIVNNNNDNRQQKFNSNNHHKKLRHKSCFCLIFINIAKSVNTSVFTLLAN